MKKATMLIIPMMAHAMLAHASELPDEINYPPYERAYDNAASKVQILTSNLEQANSQLSSAYNQEANISSNIAKLEDSIYRTQGVINQNINERNRLVDVANQLNVQISDTNAQLDRAERRRNQLERNYADEDARIEPIRERVRNLTKRVNELNQIVVVENRKLKSLQDQLEVTTRELNKNNSDIVTLMDKIEAQKKRLATLDADIQQKQLNVTELTKRLDVAIAKQAAEKVKLDAISKEIADLNLQLRALGSPNSEEAKKIQAQINAKQQERKSQAALYTAANAQVEQIKNRLTTIQDALKKLQADKQQLPAQISAAESELANKRVRSSSLKQKQVELTRDVTAQDTLVKNTVAQANQASDRLSTSKHQLANESRVLDELRVKLENVNSNIRNFGESLRSLNFEFKITMDKVDSIDRALPGMRRDLSNFTRDLQMAKVDLVNVQDQIIVLNGDVSRLSSQLSEATTDRDLKYQEYISRLDYYNTQLSAAKSLGASQTDVALNLAQTDSNIVVEAKSKQLGEQMGSEMAQAQGSYWSSIRAELAGYNDGYDTGYASEESEASGQQEGTRAGIVAAQNYAQTVLKPEFFNGFFEDALKTSLFKSFEKLNATVIPFIAENEMEISDKELKSITEQVLPVSAGEIQQSLDIESGMDNKIAELANNLKAVTKQKTSFARPGNVYQTPAKIPFQSFDCSGVYKGLSVFKTACANSYQDVFATKYKNEHFENFAAQYTQLYEAVVEEMRTQDIGAVYNSNYETFYPIAYASGLSDGKEQIYKETFAIAKENAYQVEIPKATAVAKAQASDEVKTWVNANAALTITGANIIDSDLRGGSSATLAVDVKNISPQASTKPVKMIITETVNAQVAVKEIFFQNLPGKKTSTLKDLNFTISPTTVSGNQIKIAGKLILPGGKYKAERIETFEAITTAAVNPILAASELSYDASPKVKSIRSFFIHKFDITVTPAVETITEGYTIEMKPVAFAETVTMKDGTSMQTGKLVAGEKKQVTFRYVFTKSAKDKVIPMEIKYIFKGKVMKSEIIELRPH